MIKKKPVSIYPPEFLAKDIKVDDWVYAEVFQLFAVVTNVIPRVAVGTRVYDREDAEREGFSLKGSRAATVSSPLIVVSNLPGQRVQFSGVDSCRFCAGHFVKVTPELLTQFIGARILETTKALSVIKL